MENLIDVLDSENAQYEKLLVLAESKTPVIVSGDIESLGKITEEVRISPSPLGISQTAAGTAFENIPDMSK